MTTIKEDQVYTKLNQEFYEKEILGIDRSMNKWFARFVYAKVIGNWIEKNIKNKHTLYDAGGGIGNWAWYFGNKYKFKRIIVSDISKLPLSKIPEDYIEKINCSVMENKLPDSSVDCILLIDVFEHIFIKDLEKMMKDLRRILKPDGKILILTSLYGWGQGLVLQRLFTNRRLMKGEFKALSHVNRLSLKEFNLLFKRTGLEIEDYYYYCIIFQQITDDLKERFAKIVSKLRKSKERKEGQETKKSIRKIEEKPLIKTLLYLSSLISYLDILIFGKFFPGRGIFFCLKKSELH